MRSKGIQADYQVENSVNLPEKSVILYFNVDCISNLKTHSPTISRVVSLWWEKRDNQIWEIYWKKNPEVIVIRHHILKWLVIRWCGSDTAIDNYFVMSQPMQCLVLQSYYIHVAYSILFYSILFYSILYVTSSIAQYALPLAPADMAIAIAYS